VYKLGKTHVVADALLINPNITEPIGVLDQTTEASLFYTWFEWLNDVKDFLKTK
jgi:hypothetical protein